MRLRNIKEPSEDAPYGTFQLRGVQIIRESLKDNAVRRGQALLIFYTLNYIAHSKEFDGSPSPQFEIHRERLAYNCGLSEDTLDRVLPILRDLKLIDWRNNAGIVDGKWRREASTYFLLHAK